MWFEAIALGILGALAFYVGKPLFAEPGGNAEPEDRSGDLEDRKFQIYQALSDLEYDLHLQKIGLADYQRLKTSLTREALEILAGSGQQTAPVKPEAARNPPCETCGRAAGG